MPAFELLFDIGQKNAVIVILFLHSTEGLFISKMGRLFSSRRRDVGICWCGERWMQGGGNRKISPSGISIHPGMSMNISACASRVILQTLLFVLIVVTSESALSQVIIRERVPIRPSGLQSSIASTGDPASEAYIVAPSDGTMQITHMVADRAEGMIPQDAHLRITYPSVQRSDSIWSYCSSRYYGPWLSGFLEYFNECAGRPVLVNSFSTVEGFDRTIFLLVQGGDTVRFEYWSDAWVDWCEVLQGGTSWSIHLFTSSGCYYPVDSVSLWIHFSYADSGFAKLDVDAFPDTLVFEDSLRGSNAIAVIAKSTGNREVMVSDEMLVDLSLATIPPGSNQCFGFLTSQGDTIRNNSLDSVCYGDARQGKIRLLSLSKPPDSTRFVLIEASPPISSGAADGTDSIVVSRPSSVLKLASARGVVRPLRDGRAGNKLNPEWVDSTSTVKKWVIDLDRSDTTAITLTVTTPTSEPAKGYSVSLSSFGKPLTGGHTHVTSRPAGRFITADGDTVNSLSTTTDSQGLVEAIYLSSGFGGVDSILARGPNEKDTATLTITVRNPSIVAMSPPVPGVSHYTFVGERPEHPANHFATQATIDSLLALVEKAYADSLYVLQINDMSLVFGGPFDCAPGTDPWDTPHIDHRQGRSIDMRITSNDGSGINNYWFRSAARSKGFNVLRHGNPLHYHLTYNR